MGLLTCHSVTRRGPLTPCDSPRPVAVLLFEEGGSHIVVEALLHNPAYVFCGSIRDSSVGLHGRTSAYLVLAPRHLDADSSHTHLACHADSCSCSTHRSYALGVARRPAAGDLPFGGSHTRGRMSAAGIAGSVGLQRVRRARVSMRTDASVLLLEKLVLMVPSPVGLCHPSPLQAARSFLARKKGGTRVLVEFPAVCGLVAFLGDPCSGLAARSGRFRFGPGLGRHRPLFGRSWPGRDGGSSAVAQNDPK